MNDNEIAKLVGLVHTLWPTFEAMPETVPAWRLILRDLDYEPAKTAVIGLSTDGREFPPPVGMIRQRTLKALGHGAPDVDQAVEEVMGAATYLGFARQPTWTHPAIADAVRAVGWDYVCYEPNQPAVRAHLRQAYESAAARHERRSLAPQPVLEAPIPRQLPAGRTGGPE